MQQKFFKDFEGAISQERLSAYTDPPSSDVPLETLTLARYMLNMSLCESLYISLQMCEVGLRNAIHIELSRLNGRKDWYDSPSFPMTSWAQSEVANAKAKISGAKKIVTPGRVISEMTFGFWTSLFESHYEQRTHFLPSGIKGVFPHLPKSLHWKDLDSRHQQIHDVLGWLNPSLRHMAQAVDRFTELRSAGLKPWINIVQGDGRG